MEQPATKQPATKLAPFRSVCFTEFDTSRDMEELAGHFQYLCYGKEVCPKTQRDHYQGYAYIDKAQRWSWFKKIFGKTHFDQCRGTFEQNVKYCSKEGHYTEFGVKPMGSGKKRILLEIKDKIDSGERVSKLQKLEVCFEPILRYERGLRDYERRCRLDKAIDEGYKKKTVMILIGPAGSAKTRHVWDQHEPHSVYTMPDNSGKWAGTYDGQPVVLFDDVGPGDIMPLTTFLRLTDGYPYEVPIKGGFTPWTPTHIYFSSNMPITEWWSDIKEEQWLAIDRRVTDTIYK